MTAFDKKVTKKTITVPRGYTYTYYVSSASGSKPTILLCHGWPDTAHLWTNVVNNHLLPAGYGVVVPDLLGYDGTSKPTDKAEYTMDLMSADLVAILDAESLQTVVSLGHDWGAGMAQRFYNFYPSRTSGLVLLNVGYIAPMTGPFDLDAVLELTQKIFGYGTYWYWKLFTAEDGPQVLNSHPESVYDICHADPETWLQTFCKPDGFRNFVTNGQTQPVQAYAEGKSRDDFVQRMSRDGFEGPQCWYKAWVNLGHEADQKISKDAVVVNVPCLFWGGKDDKVCRPEALEDPKSKGLLPHLTTNVREGGHWAFLATPDVFGKDLTNWLDQTYGGK